MLEDTHECRCARILAGMAVEVLVVLGCLVDLGDQEALQVQDHPEVLDALMVLEVLEARHSLLVLPERQAVLVDRVALVVLHFRVVLWVHLDLGDLEDP